MKFNVIAEVKQLHLSADPASKCCEPPCAEEMWV